MLLFDLLSQIQSSLKFGHYYLALFTSLTIPDICGAIDSENGETNGTKYAQWFDNYVTPKYKAFGDIYLTGKDYWGFRCVLLHQGRTKHPKDTRPETVVFFTSRLKAREVMAFGAFKIKRNKTLYLDLEWLCNNIVQGCYEWLEKVEDTERFKKNSATFINLFTLSFEK